MSKIKFCVATDNNINLDGMTFPETIDIQDSFSMHIPTITVGRLYREGNKLMCEADIPDIYINGFPYIGISGALLETNGKKEIRQGEVFAVSIGMGPNQDEAIHRISDQIKENV